MLVSHKIYHHHHMTLMSPNVMKGTSVLIASVGIMCFWKKSKKRSSECEDDQTENHIDVDIDLTDNKVYSGYLQGIVRARKRLPQESALRDLEIEARGARATAANI